ncbi:heavy-metal-associated domain-containing protein [Bacteroidota bacterium]
MNKKFNVEGMTCHACEMLIEDGLEELGGVNSVEISHRDKFVKVDFDDNKVSEKDIAEAIKNEGFEVK